MVIVWSSRGYHHELFCVILCITVVHNDIHTDNMHTVGCWLRGAVVERWSLTSELSKFPCPVLNLQLTGDHLCR